MGSTVIGNYLFMSYWEYMFDIEIKFSTSTVGMVEGKKTEPHLIISVWY